MSAAMRLYQAAPVWVQNALITAYGYRLRGQRYGAVGRALLPELLASERLPAAELARRQLQMLRTVVASAYRDVPHYRARGTAPTLDSLEALRELPLLSKLQLKAAGRDAIAAPYAARRLLEIHTGGTTGTPLAIYCDRATLQRNYAFFSRFKRWAGVADGDRLATFAGRTLVPTATRRPPFWRDNRAANTRLLSSYHIAPDTLDAYADALAEWQPVMIDSYPSSIEPVARHLVARGDRRVRPRAVITSSETLFPEVRAIVEEAFGCRVFDHYGGAEMVALVTQCEAGSYHPNPEFGVLEVLGDDGEPVAPGEAGALVATGFINPVMPLLRYETGDRAVLGAGPCACGRAFGVLDRIEGRMDDVVVTPEGRMVGRLDPIFKSVAALYETRIVQDAADHVRVETVVVGDLPAAEEQELRRQLALRLGPSMRVDIVRVDALERTGRGKLRTVVNLLKHPATAGSVCATPATE